jgi:hypothetical protein
LKVAGDSGQVSGQGLMPGSTVTVIVHSSPRVLGSYHVSESGNFAAAFSLPALSAGHHTLTVSATSASGAAITKTTEFTVTTKGTFGLPVYLASQHPKATERTIVGTMALVLVAGGMGVGASAIGRRPVFNGGGSRAGSTTAGSSSSSAARRQREGDESEVDVDQQDRTHEAVEIGDRSATFKAPGRAFADRISLRLPNRLAAFSPLLARVMNDGSYLRAIFGALGLLVPIAGLALGILGAINIGYQALPPATGLTIAIIVLGIADVLAGFLAALAYSVLVIAGGGIHGLPDIRSLIDTDILFFSMMMVVSATRSLRRAPAASATEWYDRGSDILIGGLLGMWALTKAIGVLPALAGVYVPIAAHTEEIAFVVLGCIMIRYCFETLAAHWYPQRLTHVAPAEVKRPPHTVLWIGIIGKTAIFTFFAESYMGNVWELYAGAALLLLSMALAVYEDVLPNWPRVRKLVPAGLVGVIFGMAVGNWSYQALGHVFRSDPSQLAAWSFLLISIPLLMVQAIGTAARNGEGWALNWRLRLLGIPTLVFTVLYAQGIVSLG